MATAVSSSQPHQPSTNEDITQPVNPSLARAAQIPLQSFTISPFPCEANTLTSLTLTSDIKLSDYQSLVSPTPAEDEPTTTPAAYSIPDLPPAIDSLTLELFSLGYPPGFLTTLAGKLPNLRSLVVYSQLLGGVSDESRRDAVAFFHQIRAHGGLRALHLLDVFTRKGEVGVWADALLGTGSDRRGPMFLEVSYTCQPDEEFLARLPSGEELSRLVSRELVACTMNMSPVEVTDDPDDPNNLSERVEDVTQGEGGAGARGKEWMVTLNKSHAAPIVEALTREESRPDDLKVLNTSVVTMTLEQARKVLKVHKGLLLVRITVEVEEKDGWKNELLETLKEVGKEVEQVELLGDPTLGFSISASKMKAKPLEKAFPSRDDMAKLQSCCPNLNSFKATLLRKEAMEHLEWIRQGDDWE